MALERQRGITIQAAVTSFDWKNYKINIVDTPGHMDFLAEVYRSLSVLDGAILVISAKDGVQAQTRVLFHALRKMKIPTIIFVNKIDQGGINLQSVYQNIREKLSDEIIVMQDVLFTPEVSLTDIADIEKWESVVGENDGSPGKVYCGRTFGNTGFTEGKMQKNTKQFPVSCLSWKRKEQYRNGKAD